VMELGLRGNVERIKHAVLNSHLSGCGYIVCSLHNLRDPHRGQCQAGSLTGAVHLSKGNAGVLRLAQ
jgi:hypothetical protein